MKKAKLEVKTSSLALVLTILTEFVDKCDEESKVKLLEILKFFYDRIEKPYHFVEEDHLLTMWKVLKACFDDELIAPNDGEYKAIMEVYMKLAFLLDNKSGKEWKDFTLIPNLVTSSPMSESSPEKSSS